MIQIIVHSGLASIHKDYREATPVLSYASDFLVPVVHSTVTEFRRLYRKTNVYQERIHIFKPESLHLVREMIPLVKD